MTAAQIISLVTSLTGLASAIAAILHSRQTRQQLHKALPGNTANGTKPLA